MNRLIINHAARDACIPCGGAKQIRIDVSDFGIIGVFPCPACQGGLAIREFLSPLTDYLGGSVIPDGVA